MSISVVIPVAGACDNLSELVSCLSDEVDQIVITVDEETTIDVPPDVCVVRGSKGRGGQIRRGIRECLGTIVWVLHADTKHPESGLAYLQALDPEEICWGRFDVRLPGLPVIGFLMNWRSRLTKICTGDQGMFFHKRALEHIDGFPDQMLMEDLEVSARLKRWSGAAFLAPSVAVVSSPRRWQQHGVMKTVLTMWWLRIQYFFAVPTDVLYRRYYK